MRTDEAIKFFGSKKKLGKALGIKAPETSIWYWGEFPPMARQYEIQALTKGKLKADKAHDALAVRKVRYKASRDRTAQRKAEAVLNSEA